MPQRLDGVELGGLVGRVETEEDAHRGRRTEGQQDGLPSHDRAHVAGLAKDPRTRHSGHHADEPAHQAEYQGFDEELEADVAWRSAHRLADADLPRPLGHADQHDVHDADAAHDQRHPGHPGQQVSEGGRRRFLGLDDALLGRDGKVRVFQRDVVAFRQQKFDLLDGIFDRFPVLDLDIDHPNPVSHHPGKHGRGEFLEHNGDGSVKPCVVIHIADQPLFGHDANHGQFGVAHSDHLTNRVCISEKLLGQAVSQHRHFLLLVHLFLFEVTTLFYPHIPHCRKARGRAQDGHILQRDIPRPDRLLSPLLDHYGRNAFNFLRNGKGIVVHQSSSAAGLTHGTWAPATETGSDKDQIGSQAGDPLLNGGFGAGADGDHDDHRRHADDDAQHGQQRAHLVAGDAFPGDPDSLPQVHFIPPKSGSPPAGGGSWKGILPVRRAGGRCVEPEQPGLARG